MNEFKTLLVIALLVPLAACSDGSDSSVVMVPIEEDLPYAEFEYQLIEKGEAVLGAAWPTPVQKLHSLLTGADGLVFDTLGVQHSGDIDLEFLADGRWILLDRERDELMEIDPAIGESVHLASQGDGPGELQFAMDAVSIGQMVYVSRAGMAVSVFGCQESPCKYKEDIGLGIMAHQWRLPREVVWSHWARR